MKEYFGQYIEVEIDRAKGSKHPEFDMIYPINYGYIPNTLAPDGEEIDVYVIDIDTPIKKTSGYIIAGVIREDDVEYKLVMAKEKNKYSKQQIEDIIHFQEKYFKSTIILHK